jgi:signal transduction histidine kinase
VLNFRVLPAWYQTLWFRSGVVLLIIGFGAGTAWLVQRQRHLRFQQVLEGRFEATLAERARIAQDLHDTLLQGIAGVSMQLKAAERALPDEPDVAAETLVQVQQLTRETLREARERVLDLNEPDLGDEDVASALATSGRGLIGTTGINFSLTTRGNRGRLPRTVEIAAIRIGREAIANAVNHAEARRIELVVGFEAAALRLEVRDDGRGFTPEQGERARRDGHLGLSGMRERAARAGGSCEVRPGPEGGTEVAVVLPLGPDTNVQ